MLDPQTVMSVGFYILWTIWDQPYIRLLRLLTGFTDDLVYLSEIRQFSVHWVQPHLVTCLGPELTYALFPMDLS